jgi:hypothetical protein
MPKPPTKPVDRPTHPAVPPWHQTHGTYIAGRSFLDAVDMLAAEMEAKWGAGRLRLLVPQLMRERFDRQRYLLNQAVWHGDIEAVRTQAPRMATAWRVLDEQATRDGQGRLGDMVWEITLGDGGVAAIVPDAHHASKVQPEGRHVRVYTLDEIGRLLTAFPELAKAKETFPGATVIAARRTIPDPLDAIADTQHGLDDDLDDRGPFDAR